MDIETILEGPHIGGIPRHQERKVPHQVNAFRVTAPVGFVELFEGLPLEPLMKEDRR